MSFALIKAQALLLLVGAILCIIILRPYHSSLLLFFEHYELSRFSELDWERIEFEWERLRIQIPEPWKLQEDGREFQVGEALSERGLKPVHPVVVIPGVITTVRILNCVVLFLFFLKRLLQHLVSWTTAPEYRRYFRERFWGGYK